MEEFHGRYKNILDAKGRINMPARFREFVEKDGNDEHLYMLTKGTEKYVAVFTMAEWRRKLEDIELKVQDGKKRRIIFRRIHHDASIQKIDKQGRINIPAELIEYAGLEKEVFVLGTGKKIEIWNPAALKDNLHEVESEYQEISDVIDF